MLSHAADVGLLVKAPLGDTSECFRLLRFNATPRAARKIGDTSESETS
jgi:hypothetical protein